MYIIKGLLLLMLVHYGTSQCTTNTCKLNGLFMNWFAQIELYWIDLPYIFFSIETFSADGHNKKVAENKLSMQIIALLEHYKQKDPVGLPGAPVPDPFPIEDLSKSFAMGKLTMKNTLAYGFSKFRIKHIELDVNALLVS